MHQVRERQFHPSVYERLHKTIKLKDKGINPDEFRKRGGLDDLPMKP